ncbi:MAG: TonB-dependent receptor [Pseudomonadota bacterium]
MKKFTSLKATVAPVALGLAMLSTPAFAQDQEEEAAEDEGLIVVTGSRIASPTLTSTAPLQIIDDVAIDDAGVTNVQELLLENPAFGTPALSRTNSAFLTSGTGVASVDLRDLGSARTLVLVNNRRVVAGLPGTATVDLNVIPTQFIERIDVLTGGASSLYGSDAIAGVVNFIYKKDFEGIEANAQYGITEQGDDARYQLNTTIGANFAEGRGNIMVHLGYSNEEGVLSRQRSNTFLDDADTATFITGDLADFGVPFEPFNSSGAPQGRFDVAGTGSSADDFTFDPVTGVIRQGFSANGNGTIGPDGFNRQFFRTIAVPVERYLFAAAGNYEFTDDINFFFEGTYSSTRSSRIIEPFFFSSADVFPSGGRVPLETDVNGVLVVNPLVPQEIVDASQDIDGDGLRDYGFIRRIVEFGPRQGSTSRDTYRFVVGFDGTLFDDTFRWDVSYNYGRTSENQFSSGQVNTVNTRFALAAIPDVNDVNGNGSTTDAICADPVARDQGCVPINLFGAGSISPAALAYTNAESSFQTEITQQVIQGNISGSLFELPGGPLGIAAGVEYRRENSVEELDALTNAGLNAGNALPDNFGGFNVIEGFLEVKAPILSDVPGFQLLEIGGAIRVADYSTVGSVVSYNGQATWKPIDDLTFRGTYARSVRAPNIGELFDGRSQTFPSGLTDPCVGIGATGGGALGDNCRASPGVNQNIANNTGVGINPLTGAAFTNAFTLNQADLQGISGFNGGNPNLFEETATSWTIGAVINPVSIDALRNVQITVDYYNISIDDVIAAPARGFTLTQCFNNGNPNFCSLITRRATGDSQNSPGSIEFIDATAVNGALLEAEGIDVTAAYRTSLDSIGLPGTLNARIAYTHVLTNNFFPAIGESADVAAGEIGTAEDRFTANLGYEQGPFRMTMTGTFIGRSYEDDVGYCAFFDDGSPECVSVPAEFYLDTQLNYTVNDNFEFYFGVDNLLDNDAPNLLTGTTFNVTGTDTAADVYDVFGRRYYTGVRMRF